MAVGRPDITSSFSISIVYIYGGGGGGRCSVILYNGGGPVNVPRGQYSIERERAVWFCQSIMSQDLDHQHAASPTEGLF